ncbi:hypothetical protein C4J81_06360 [Deltaproteobacteria bacterium Smac51]|nr:hypothetical protein C4J81_06360 [Deltaproteobacteria bacterium Smac51]
MICSTKLRLLKIMCFILASGWLMPENSCTDNKEAAKIDCQSQKLLPIDNGVGVKLPLAFYVSRWAVELTRISLILEELRDTEEKKILWNNFTETEKGQLVSFLYYLENLRINRELVLHDHYYQQKGVFSKYKGTIVEELHDARDSSTEPDAKGMQWFSGDRWFPPGSSLDMHLQNLIYKDFRVTSHKVDDNLNDEFFLVMDTPEKRGRTLYRIILYSQNGLILSSNVSVARNPF